MSVTRRNVLKAGLLTGSGALLGDVGSLLQARAQSHEGSSGPSPYPLADPDNIIYGMCLQCHTECTLKIKIQDGLVAKIDGNAYSPGSLQPQVDYATPLDQAAQVDGSICPKGQAGVQTLYDPYRLRRVLKRDGPRGSGKWKSIPFDQAIKDVVDGGTLFSDIGENRTVAGFRNVFAVRNAELSKALAADVAAVRGGTMDVAAFRQRHQDHLNVLIDPEHPDFGPKNNQFVFMATNFRNAGFTAASAPSTGTPTRPFANRRTISHSSTPPQNGPARAGRPARIT
jgi:tetrathionate reductase subunit A